MKDCGCIWGADGFVKRCDRNRPAMAETVAPGPYAWDTPHFFRGMSMAGYTGFSQIHVVYVPGVVDYGGLAGQELDDQSYEFLDIGTGQFQTLSFQRLVQFGRN